MPTWMNFLLLLPTSVVYAIWDYRMLTPRYPKKKFFYLGILMMALLSALSLWRPAWVMESAGGLVGAFLIVALGGYILVGRLLSTSPFSRVVLCHIISVVVMAIGNALSSALLQMIYDQTGAKSGITMTLFAYGDLLLCSLVQCILMLGISAFFAQRRNRLIADVRWNMFAMLLMTQMAALIIINVLLRWDGEGFGYMQNAVILGGYTLLCIPTDLFIIRTFLSLKRNAELEQEIALLDQQKELEHAQVAATSEQMANIRRLRHDYSNTLDTIGTLLRMGETARIEEILNDTAQMLEQTTLVRTGNLTVDAVLYSKIVAAKTRGIQLSASLLWPERLHVSDTDVMRIFSNLLDNAICYCETLPEGTARCIDVSSVLRGGLLVLDFANTFIGEAVPCIPAPGAEPPATQPHGHGLSIVRAIAEKNGGTLLVDRDGDTLIFRVLLGGAPVSEV